MLQGASTSTSTPSTNHGASKRYHDAVEEEGAGGKKCCQCKLVKSNCICSPSASDVDSCSRSGRVLCRVCNRMCENRRVLYLHRMTQHGSGEDLQQFDHEIDRSDEELSQVYDANLAHILGSHRDRDGGRLYNFPVNGLSDNMSEISSHLNDIERNEDHSFKINLAVGMILRRGDEIRYRYFIPHENEMVLDAPVLITSPRDVLRLTERLSQMDLHAKIMNARPDSGWKPYLITNIVYYTYDTGFPMGKPVQLPAFVQLSRSVISLCVDSSTKAFYKDNLCIFRALACHQHKVSQPNSELVKHLYEQWCEFVGKHVPADKFRGLELKQLDEFEICFNINVNVYEMVSTSVVVPRLRSMYKHQDTLNLNVYKQHFSYIKCFKTYAKVFRCSHCSRQFPKLFNWSRHIRVCSNGTKLYYPGGFMKTKQTIFDELQDRCGINVNKADRSFNHFIVFDFESMLEKTQVRTSDKLVWVQKHVPISVSICSNVEGFKKPICFVNTKLDELLDTMIAYMNGIVNRSHELANRKWADVHARLRQCIEMYNDDADEGDQENDNSEGQDTDSDFEDQSVKDNNPHRFVKRTLVDLAKRFETYCRQIPVLSFNGARYDLNLIKSQFAKKLDLANDKKAFTIKKANSYVAVRNSDYIFLDISQYLSAGSSYDQFLKAFGASVPKGFFCYEFLDCKEKLKFDHLPPREAFYSTLKKCNVLGEGEVGEANYRWLQEVWQAEGMKSLKDLLRWYNNRDCEGFVEAVEKMQKFYLENDIDLFKDCISVPGVARILLFRSTSAKFPLFDHTTQDIYKTINASAAGGPSIVFCRYHEKDKTYIRGNPNKTCKKILGQDANALYLNCFRQAFPTGVFVDRKFENRFKAEPSIKYLSMYFWMDRVAERLGVSIQHRLNNNNKEVFVDRYPVDGFDSANKIVYEFQGCYYHPHDGCPLVKDKHRIQKRAQVTKEKHEQLRKIGYMVVHIQECVFNRDVKPHCTEIIDRYLPPFYRANKSKTLNQTTIQRAVCAEELFGLVEVDISVPRTWDCSVDRQYLLNGQLPFKHSTMTPHEYFAEFSPLFLTTDIPFDAIGRHMQQHVEAHNISKNPRTLLVGGLYAKNMLLASPLLKWYLEHGLVVTKIHRVVEFTPMACFRDFADKVASARRDGDADPSKAIIADTCKLWGNSAFGSVLMNKERHRSITHVDSLHKMKWKVNEPQFRHLTPLGDDQFEIESAKRRITLDIPNYLGFFILNYAKMHMLSYYYDCLDRYVPRDCFELTQIDTDSAYFAISGERFIDVVRPHLREEFMRKIHGQCGVGAIEADGSNWYPRACCEADAKYDRRTPGLFKLEAEGDTMISLASKTYLLTCGEKFKMSCKGLNKRNVLEPLSIYKNVLLNKQPSGGENSGFRAKDNTVFTYNQQKGGFPYFYAKREVLDDGVSTRPLTLVLNPLRNDHIEYVDYNSVLSNHFVSHLEFLFDDRSMRFISAHHLFCYMKAKHHNKNILAEQIRNCKSPFELQKINMDIQIDDEWDSVREERMKTVLTVKWAFCRPFDRALRASKAKFVVCGYNGFWECGFNYRIARVTSPDKFTGRNKLGEILEEMRANIVHMQYINV